MAVAHAMLIIACHILKRRRAYHDLATDYFDRLDGRASQKRLIKELAGLGYQVTLKPASPETTPQAG